jgi:hypothetical protein
LSLEVGWHNSSRSFWHLTANEQETLRSENLERLWIASGRLRRGRGIDRFEFQDKYLVDSVA